MQSFLGWAELIHDSSLRSLPRRDPLPENCNVINTGARGHQWLYLQLLHLSFTRLNVSIGCKSSGAKSPDEL